MRKTAHLIIAIIALSACKKEQLVTPKENHPPTNSNLVYVSDIPLNAVSIHNDTLTCDTDYNVYEYTKISDSQFVSSRIFWNTTQNWTNWNQGVISYFSNDTLYIHM